MEHGYSYYDGYYDESGGSYRRQLGDLYHGCLPLTITHPDFWDEEDDDMQFAPLQAAAVLAIISAVAGGIALVQLISASCFELQPCKLLFIAIVQIVCAVFTFVSIFVAAGVDLCKDVDNCERHRVAGMRLAEGSVAAIFAAFFYGWAALTVFGYRMMVVRNANTMDAEPDETQELVPTTTTTSQQVKTVTSPPVYQEEDEAMEEVELGSSDDTDPLEEHDSHPQAGKGRDPSMISSLSEY